ncbi:DUF4926 domain-containing protein [uncultured Thiodictyon sp.]|uniref:DUF4926 domain-containing protein n=1 Tax=uncultured Thiodictyon sp. TaxID=1846217 RepID=UPI0025FDF403|nr:DUF4926 domain-containing protein [uncultured Thiodictyon sp.]
MTQHIKPFDVVALTGDLPDRGLLTGQVGTLVESLGQDVFEVEFIDDEGRTYALTAIGADRLLVLRYDLAQAASG